MFPVHFRHATTEFREGGPHFARKAGTDGFLPFRVALAHARVTANWLTSSQSLLLGSSKSARPMRTRAPRRPTLITTIGAAREVRSRWSSGEIELLRDGEAYRLNWWRHVEPRQGMWRALCGLNRCIATARVAKHRLFVWLDARILPDSKVIVIARDDDVTFGILHSRFHEAWSLRLCSWHGVGNDPVYNPSTVFQTFPFPDGLRPDTPAADYADNPCAIAIAEAARRLVALRERWLNPPEWVDWVDEPVPGYPQRPVARDEPAAKELGARSYPRQFSRRRWLSSEAG